MTCQWCKYYRRRVGDLIVCLHPERNWTTIDVKGGGTCEFFDPRQNCTTCAHRCTQAERQRNMDMEGNCSMWNLRELGRWGGFRRRSCRPVGRPKNDISENDIQELINNGRRFHEAQCQDNEQYLE